MLSYAAGPTDVPLLDTTIGADLERTVARHGDREALVECATGRRWTYAELDRDVDRLARAPLAAGLAAGDRVGIWAPSCAEWVLVQYATVKVGVVLVTDNPAYRTSELAYVLQQSGAGLLVSATESKGSDYRAMVDEVRPDCPALDVRSKDMVIRGGEHVSPREVEEFLHTHPDVADVHVVGVPGARYGDSCAPGSACARAPSR